MNTLSSFKLKVADEAFLLVADLHRRNPQAVDFSVAEILDHARQLNLFGSMRPGVEIHVRQHCVANLPPNPGKYRMLFASAKARRRLLLPDDPVDPRRDGKIWPDPADLPDGFLDLLEWAKSRYGLESIVSPPFSKLLALRGTGKDVWLSEPADDYISRLREDEN